MALLRYKDVGHGGGFIAYGCGFYYSYTVDSAVLSIYAADRDTVLRRIECSKFLRKDIYDFIETLEKATMIQALILSNHTSTNLANTMVPERLAPILDNALDFATMAFDITHNRIKKFTDHFALHFDLKDFQIRKVLCRSSKIRYYRGFIRSHNNQDGVVRDIDLGHLLKRLSKVVTSELIAAELSIKNKAGANQLLLLSSRLCILGRIINHKYDPMIHVKTPLSLATRKSG